MSAALQTAQAAKRFTLGGRAVVTLSSKKTGNHYTYKVTAPENRSAKDFAFVSLLTAPDTFTYLGVLTHSTFNFTAKSKLAPGSTPVKALQFFCEKVLVAELEPEAVNLEVRHEGKCGCCGRPLTVPESIDRGIGPDCWEKGGF